MFIHIGNNYLLRKRDLIGIFNVDALQQDTKGRRFLNDIKQNDSVEDISEGKWSSVVLSDEGTYVSRISTATLLSRSREAMSDVFSMPKKPAPPKKKKPAPPRTPDEQSG